MLMYQPKWFQSDHIQHKSIITNKYQYGMVHEVLLSQDSIIKFWLVFFLTERNAFSFKFTKMNWQLIINKPFAHLYKLLTWDIFDFCNVLMSKKKTTVFSSIENCFTFYKLEHVSTAKKVIKTFTTGQYKRQYLNK